MSVNIWSNGNLVPIASSGTYVYNTPLGSIIAFSGNNIPVGFLLCDGSTLNKNEYLDLFNVIGYTYGGSDNEFKLPDLRERFIQGANENLGESIEAGLPNITGSFGNWNQWTGSRYGYGAFSARSDGGAAGFRASGNDDRTGVTFKASNGETKTDGTLKNDVYGKSDHVTPYNISFHMWKRTA